MPVLPIVQPSPERQPIAPVPNLAVAQQPSMPMAVAVVEAQRVAPSPQNDNALPSQTPTITQGAVKVQPQTLDRQPVVPVLPRAQQRQAMQPEIVVPMQARAPVVLQSTEQAPVKVAPPPVVESKAGPGAVEGRYTGGRQDRLAQPRDIWQDNEKTMQTPAETRKAGGSEIRPNEQARERGEGRSVVGAAEAGKREVAPVSPTERVKSDRDTVARQSEPPTKVVAEVSHSFHDRVADTVKQTEKVQDAFKAEKEKTCRDTCTSGGDCARCGAAAAMQRMLANLQP